MYRRKTIMAAVMVAAAIAILTPVSAIAQELVLKRVMLSAGGVGYFEYEARVEGDAVLKLSVRLGQVDDVMKSIVVYDDKGVAGAIRLPGREPLAQIFRDLPFGPQALASPVALLNSLTGAEIRATGQRQIEGRLVRVVPEDVGLPSLGGTITRHRVTVMTATGMQTFLFEEADSIEFTDPELKAQIEGALAAVSAHRTRDRRTREIVSNGKGKRTVRIGYVVAAPLWKASYRLTLGGAEAKTARLQGWAVLENMSGQDWQGVELTLVSGNPVTFRQALYAAYYVDRPEVPVEVLGRVLPKPDTGTVDLEMLASGELEEEFRREQGRLRGFDDEKSKDERMMAKRMAPAMMQDQLMGAASEAAVMANLMAPPPGQARIVAAASSEAATSVTFRIPYPVVVSAGESLLVPVIDRAVPAKRVSLYQPATHERHPLAAVRLTNDGETGLPPGVLTLYETGERGFAFVGDAQLSPLPAGDERLVSFALDQKTLIDREVKSSQTIAKGRIAKGIFELTLAQEQRTIYRLAAPAREARELLIEHPRIPDWKLEKPDPKDAKLTEGQYRITRRLEAGGKAELEVVLTHPLVQRIGLVNLGAAQYAQYAKTGELDKKLRAAFRKMADLRSVMDGHERLMRELEQDRKRIHQEQKRIRDNLARIPRDSDLYKRYMKKLNAQEDSLESILSRSENTREAATRARAALTDYIQGLDI